MGKYIGFILCVICGILLLGLSLITDNLQCSHYDNSCLMQSKISFINYNISRDEFKASELGKVYCDKSYQPSRKGKKVYFVLKFSKKNSEREYTLGTFPKFAMCKNELTPLERFLNKQTNLYNYSSGLGITNILGFLLSLVVFIVAVVIITGKEEQDSGDWEEDDN